MNAARQIRIIVNGAPHFVDRAVWHEQMVALAGFEWEAKNYDHRVRHPTRWRVRYKDAHIDGSMAPGSGAKYGRQPDASRPGGGYPYRGWTIYLHDGAIVTVEDMDAHYAAAGAEAAR